MKFGTYFRDMVGQDYAQHRYYSSNLGRFYTPDPAGRKAANPKNPTSWNMYAYVNDDPVNGNDPTGMDVVTTDPYTSYVQSLCSTDYTPLVDPYNSFCGGGNGAGWGSESAIGAAVEDTVEQYDSTVYNLGPNTPTFSVTTTAISDDDPGSVPGSAPSDSDAAPPQQAGSSSSITAAPNPFPNSSSQSPGLPVPGDSTWTMPVPYRNTGTYGQYASCFLGGVYRDVVLNPEALVLGVVGVVGSLGQNINMGMPAPIAAAVSAVATVGVIEGQMGADASACSQQTGYVPWVFAQ